MKALQCPFLTGIPIGQVRQQAGELLKLADRCPVMGHVIKYASAANEETSTALCGPEGKFSALLWPPASSLADGHYIFLLMFLSSYLLFSSPNLGGLWADRHQTLPHVRW